MPRNNYSHIINITILQRLHFTSLLVPKYNHYCVIIYAIIIPGMANHFLKIKIILNFTTLAVKTRFTVYIIIPL